MFNRFFEVFFFQSLFILISVSSFGQTKVCVYDFENQDPIVGATVVSDGGQFLNYTDYKGCLVVDTNNVSTVKVYSFLHHPKTVIFENEPVVEVFLEPKFNELNTVTISSSKFADSVAKVPQTIQTFQSKDIEESLKSNAADILEQSGEVYIQKSQLGGGSPVLRGFEANRVLLVVDGIRMNNAIYRSGHLQNIVTLDPLNQDQIDVVYGPSSTLYGSDAIGGAVHFQSKKNQYSLDSNLFMEGKLYSHYGSAAQEQRIHGQFHVANSKWSNITSLSLTSYGDLMSGKNIQGNKWLRTEYIDRIEGKDVIVKNNDPYKQTYSGYEQVDLSTKFGYKPNSNFEHIISVQYSNSSDVPRYDRLAEYDDNDTLKYARWDYGPQERMLTYYKFKHQDSTRFYDNAEVIFSYQNIKESRINRRFESSIENNRNEKVDKVAVNLNFQKFFSPKSQLQYGAEVSNDWVTSTAFAKNIIDNSESEISTRYPDGGSTWGAAGLYGYYKKELKEQVFLDAGARLSLVKLKANFDDTTFYNSPVDEVKQNNSAFNATLGITKVYNNGWTLAVLGASGFRAPNIDDVGKVFDSRPGNVVVPNADLKPEKIYNLELKVRKETKVYTSQITPFFSYIVDMIAVSDFTYEGQDSIIYDGTLSKVEANTNTGRAVVGGVSFYLKSKVSKHFRAQLNMTYTYGRDIENNLPLGHIPPLFGGLSFQHILNELKIRQEVKMLFNGVKRGGDYNPFTDKINLATPDGLEAWYTLNYSINWKPTYAFTIFGKVENILDLHYRTFSSGINAPGRNFQIGGLLRF